MPSKRVPPSERIRNEIMARIQHLDPHGSKNSALLGQVLQLGMRRLIQELLEAEVSEHVGTAYYEHAAARRGYRNGYKPATIKTAEQRLTLEKPQIAESAEPFRSQLWPHLKGRSPQLERMAVEMYARGCSTRDIEALLKDETGQLLLSRSTISQLNERLWQEYETFCKADLAGYDLIYLFADAVYESLRLHQSRKEGILVVWGILASGTKVLLTMRLGNKESFEDWQEVFRDLVKRGLPEPVLGTTDGAPGLIRAFETVFPKSLRQRCLVHKKRNILAKVPDDAAPDVKARLNAVYYAPDLATAHRQAQAFRDHVQARYPSAVACFEDDLPACLAHLRCPPRHRRHISSTNLVERGFLEEKRRSGTIPRFFNEQSGLKLVFATLIRAAQTWNRMEITFDEQMQLLQLRQQLGLTAPHEPRITRNHRAPRTPRQLSRTKRT